MRKKIHMHKREGDWIQTYSGIQFWPLDPRPEEVWLKDIAHALSNQCRFAGHCLSFYSVAQHAILVSRSVPKEYAIWGLLHDAAEAYLVDLPRPIKNHSTLGNHYRRAEEYLMRTICTRFGLPVEEPWSVRIADNRVLMTEKRDLLSRSLALWAEPQVEPLVATIRPWQPRTAERKFLLEATILGISGELF